MQVSEIKIQLCPDRAGRLKAFCSITLDSTFVIHDIKIIEGDDGLFLAMPSRKICDNCPRCRDKNHLKARFCNHCGMRLNEQRHERYRISPNRLKLHSDLIHPINGTAREELEHKVFSAYLAEQSRSREPGYIASRVDTDVPELAMQNTPVTNINKPKV